MKLSEFCLLLNFILTQKTVNAASQYANNSEARLLNYLFTDYRADVRPVIHDRDPVKVNLKLALRRILELDVVNEILTTSVWIRMIWKSELTTWSPDQFGGLKSININPTKLWRPDIILYNRAARHSGTSNLYARLDTAIVVRHTGEVTWLSPAIFNTECKIDVKLFPFDSHKCPLQFGSWTNDNTKISMQLSKDSVDTGHFSHDNEWYFEKMTAELQSEVYNCCPEPYSTIKFSILIKRRAMFYVFNLIIPCGLITMMSLFSFILPPNSGERVSFVITVLLSLSVYMLIIIEKIPQSADIPFSSKLFMFMMVQVALSLIVTCLIIRFHNKNTPMPKLFRLVVNRWLARILLMGDAKEANTSVEFTGIQRHANAISPTNSTFYKDEDVADQRVREKRATSTDNSGQNLDNPDNCQSCVSIGKGIENLTKQVAIFADKIRETETRKRLQSDWGFAAEVLDRLLLLLSAGGILACIGMFVAASNDSVLH